MSDHQRPRRSDAVRNRAKILEAARTEIAAYGPEVGMDEIAASAGVAVGTLYRHFPTKTDLVTAVLTEYTEQLTAAVEDALRRGQQGEPPLRLIMGFLREAIRVSALNKAAKAAAPALGAGEDVDESRAAAALADLIDLGISVGQVRDDLTVADIYLLVTTAPLDQPEPARERWADLVLPCLTAAAARINLEEGSPTRTGSPCPA